MTKISDTLKNMIDNEMPIIINDIRNDSSIDYKTVSILMRDASTVLSMLQILQSKVNKQ